MHHRLFCRGGLRGTPYVSQRLCLVSGGRRTPRGQRRIALRPWRPGARPGVLACCPTPSLALGLRRAAGRVPGVGAAPQSGPTVRGQDAHPGAISLRVRSLRSKLLFSFVAIILLPLLTLGVLGPLISVRAIERSEGRRGGKE